MVVLIYFQSFCQKSAERKSPTKYLFEYHFVRDVSPRFWTDYLLDFGEFSVYWEHCHKCAQGAYYNFRNTFDWYLTNKTKKKKKNSQGQRTKQNNVVETTSCFVLRLTNEYWKNSWTAYIVISKHLKYCNQ